MLLYSSRRIRLPLRGRAKAHGDHAPQPSPRLTNPPHNFEILARRPRGSQARRSRRSADPTGNIATGLSTVPAEPGLASLAFQLAAGVATTCSDGPTSRHHRRRPIQMDGSSEVRPRLAETRCHVDSRLAPQGRLRAYVRRAVDERVAAEIAR